MTSPTPPADHSWAMRLNRWALTLSRHYLKVLLTVIGIFAALPVLAPVLMKVGATGASELIYNMYSPLCHQFAYRSLFLFGEQSVYPRDSVQIGEAKPYESFLPQIMTELGDRQDHSSLAFELNSKIFLGDPQMGWKVAVCQRDMGIYWALFIGGLIYAIPRVRRVLRPAPIWLYIFLGLGPVGLDGFAQLLSYPPFELWPVRETTPLFRFVTGALFGLLTAWMAFPYLEASARETVKEISAKFNRRKLRERTSAKSKT